MSYKHLRKASLGTAFLLASSAICAFSQSGELPIKPADPAPTIAPATPAPQTATLNVSAAPYQGPDVELAKRIYRAQVERALINDPYLYKSIANVSSSPTDGMRRYEESMFKRRQAEDADARNAASVKVEAASPGGDLGGGKVSVSKTISDKDIAQYALMQQREREKNEILTEISSDTGSAKLKSMTQKIADLAYSKESELTLPEHEFLGFINTTIKPQSKMMPLSPSGPDALLTVDPAVQETLSRIRISPKEMRLLLERKKQLDQIDDEETRNNFTDEKQQIVIFTKISNQVIAEEVEAPEPKSNEQQIETIDKQLSDNSGRYTATQKQGFEVRKEKLEIAATQAKVQKYEAGVQGARDYGDAFFAFAGILSKSPDVARVHQGFTAATNITKAVGRMLINGALDPSGISSIAQGIGTIASLFGPHDDANSQIFAMLQEILENQRKMLAQLKRMEGKIDKLDLELEYIIKSVDDLHTLDKNGFTDTQYKLAQYITKTLESQRAATIAILHEFSLEKARNDLQGLEDSYSASEQLACLTGQVKCSAEALAYFNTLRFDARSLHDALVLKLVNPPYFTEENISTYDRGRLVGLFEEVALENRNGMLASSADVLNDFLQKQIAANQSNASRLNSFARVNMSSLSRQPPIGEFTNAFLPTYADAITHFPPPFDYSESISEIERALSHVEDAPVEMRKSVRLARSAFMTYAIDIAERISEKMILAGINKHIEDRYTINLDNNEPDIVAPHKKSFHEAAAAQPFAYYKFAPLNAQFQLWPFVWFHSTPFEYHVNGVEEEIIDKSLPTRHLIKSSDNGPGIRFAGLNKEEIRSYIDGLNEQKFASLGLQLSVFNLKRRYTHSTIVKPRAVHQQVTIDSLILPDSSALDFFLNHGGQGLKRESDLLVEQQVRTGRETTQRVDPRKSIDVAKIDTIPSKITPDDRKPWVDLLTLYIDDLHTKVLKDVKSSIQEGPRDDKSDFVYQKQRTELTRMHFIVDTFVRAGLGECFYSEPDLKPLRDELQAEWDIEDAFKRLENAPTLVEFIKTYDEVLDAIVKMENAPLPDLDTYQYISGCHLGWGDIDHAREALDRASAYNKVISASPAPH
jgi:hypothetical protein